jgi:sensor domain CHASE-containing protein
LAALVGLALLLSVAAVHQASERQDQLQRQSETKAIEYVIRQLGEALAAEVRDYAWWDEAVRHLLPEPDPNWADQNVGPFVFERFGYEVSAVLVNGGRPAYGHVEGKRDLAGALHRLGSSLPRLAALAAEPGSGGMPRSVGIVLTGSDGLYFAAAGPILSSAEASRAHAAGRAGVLVFAKRLDDAFLDKL